jgi:hypothetical protein
MVKTYGNQGRKRAEKQVAEKSQKTGKKLKKAALGVFSEKSVDAAMVWRTFGR